MVLLIISISITAFLYSSVGHAGASGYIAVMSLLSIPILLIKPTSLYLNIIVAIISSTQFIQNKHFSFKLFFPFIITSIPMAFIGGYLKLPIEVIKIFMGVLLLISALFLIFKYKEYEEVKKTNIFLQLFFGALIGLFSGITGTGGGIFLTPLILFMGWSKAKIAAGVSALFILLNSISGIVGYYASHNNSQPLWFLAIPVIIFGFIGSYLGSKKIQPKTLFIFLGLVLLIASGKLVFRL
ncbi:MAG: sulfite exporter TauE/SafE family protein [Desulfamplus sp.]|nr:sulfite exporter TauE/SafE family protein [Desulfamplus sp.]